MKLFFSYLRQNASSIGRIILFFLIFLLSFQLYHLPLQAVLYPAALCGGFGLFFLAADFFCQRKKHRYLERLSLTLPQLNTPLPESCRILEKDYQRLISLLLQEQEHRENELERRYSDMMEYYTTWVHQIKTPIAAMRLTLQSEDSSFSRQLSSQLLRIEQYVEMVLMFLRLDAEDSDYVIREYPLEQLVHQAVKKFAGEFIQRRLQLQLEISPVSVITDEKWLSFVIEQLLSNALKYTPPGGKIHIFLQSPCTLCIQDTGIGIAPEDLPRIFQQGYTGNNGRTYQQASGLGLYLCQRICRNLGHRMSVSSVLGEGSVFSLDLSRQALEIE